MRSPKQLANYWRKSLVKIEKCRASCLDNIDQLGSRLTVESCNQIHDDLKAHAEAKLAYWENKRVKS